MCFRNKIKISEYSKSNFSRVASTQVFICVLSLTHILLCLFNFDTNKNSCICAQSQAKCVRVRVWVCVCIRASILQCARVHSSSESVMSAHEDKKWKCPHQFQFVVYIYILCAYIKKYTVSKSSISRWSKSAVFLIPNSSNLSRSSCGFEMQDFAESSANILALLRVNTPSRVPPTRVPLISVDSLNGTHRVKC